MLCFKLNVQSEDEVGALLVSDRRVQGKWCEHQVLPGQGQTWSLLGCAASRYFVACANSHCYYLAIFSLSMNSKLIVSDPYKSPEGRLHLNRTWISRCIRCFVIFLIIIFQNKPLRSNISCSACVWWRVVLRLLRLAAWMSVCVCLCVWAPCPSTGIVLLVQRVREWNSMSLMFWFLILAGICICCPRCSVTSWGGEEDALAFRVLFSHLFFCFIYLLF